MRYRIPQRLIMLMAVLSLAGCQYLHELANVKPTPPKEAPRLVNYELPENLRGKGAGPDTLSHDAAPLSAPNGNFIPGKVVRVGLLLPLTGRHAELGKAMQDAATLSLFDKYASLSGGQALVKVELLPKDTGDTPQQAASAAASAIADGAQFIIGPLFADATEAAAVVTRAKQIPMLSLSNSDKGGNGVYMYGFSPQEQTARVVSFAMAQGRTRIAALVPDSAFGTLVLNAARSALANKGLSLVKEVRYAPEGVGLDKVANQLAAKDNGAPPFDALLLPESGAMLNTLLRSLDGRGINGHTVQLLGTGIWDDAGLIRRAPLEGAWLASSSPDNTRTFDSRFKATYQYMAPRIASLAYDAVAFAVTLAVSDRPFDVATLTSHAGFVGPANGLFRLRSDGKVERGLSVLQVQGWGFKEISPAPSGFSGQ